MLANKLAKLVVFAAIPLAMGWAAARYFVNPEPLISLGLQAHFVSFLYSIPLGYSFTVFASLRGLIGHKALSSQKNAVLGRIVVKEQRKIFRLIAFYILSAVLTICWKVSSNAEYLGISYLFGVFSVAFLSLSILTVWKLKEWDVHTTELIAKFSTEEKEKEELEKERERQLEAIERLTKDDQFSDEQKAYFDSARTERPK
jgi:hypothetical protein